MRFAIGDIHGCLETLKDLLENHIKPGKEDEIILLGDYIEKGPKSKEVLDYLISLRIDGYKLVSLLGNKEKELLTKLRNKDEFDKWVGFGGDVLLKNFGVDSIDYEKAIRIFPEKYIDFILQMPYFYEYDDFLLVHAGFNFKKDNPFSIGDDMLYIRDFKVDNSKLKNRRIIHGHNPVPQSTLINKIKSRSKLIPIDTGCVYKYKPNLGYLTSINLDRFEIISIKNID